MQRALLVALVAIGYASAYYFPNGAPHRPSRFIEIPPPPPPPNNTRPDPEERFIEIPPPPPPPNNTRPEPEERFEIPPTPNATHPEPRVFKTKPLETLRMEYEIRFDFEVPEVPKDNSTTPEPRSGVQLVPMTKSMKPVDRRRQSQCMMQVSLEAGQSVSFESPNYPQEYPNSAESTICFTSPSGTKMNVTCQDFNVEYERSCNYDYMGISPSGNPANVQKYCGKGNVQSPPTSSNKLAVTFKSDHSNPGSTASDPYRFKCKVGVSGGSDGGGGNPPGGDCNCGRRNGRIVGGQESKVNEFPWRCYMKTNRYSFFCGCSVIGNNWIMTAAHCTQAVMPLPQGDTLYVVVGDHDRSSNSETASQQIAVSEVYDHPRYNPNTMDNDISLMKVSTTIQFTQTISPLCLPYNYANDEFEGTTVTASGWGTTTQGGSVSNQLREVDLPVLTTQQCRRYMPNEITDNMICTYEPGKDTCQGDSGGSIDLLRNGRHFGIGIVSWGYGCAKENNPGVYAKVTKYLTWIDQTTGQTFCRP